MGGVPLVSLQGNLNGSPQEWLGDIKPNHGVRQRAPIEIHTHISKTHHPKSYSPCIDNQKEMFKTTLQKDM